MSTWLYQEARSIPFNLSNFDIKLIPHMFIYIRKKTIAINLKLLHLNETLFPVLSSLFVLSGWATAESNSNCFTIDKT